MAVVDKGGGGRKSGTLLPAPNLEKGCRTCGTGILGLAVPAGTAALTGAGKAITIDAGGAARCCAAIGGGMHENQSAQS
jgi:hypothetical protein